MKNNNYFQARLKYLAYFKKFITPEDKILQEGFENLIKKTSRDFGFSIETIKKELGVL